MRENINDFISKQWTIYTGNFIPLFDIKQNGKPIHQTRHASGNFSDRHFFNLIFKSKIWELLTEIINRNNGKT